MSTPPKIFRKGETIFKEGDKPGTIYIVHSGIVSIFQAKQNKKIELYKATTGQIIGEEALFGMPVSATAAAVNDTAVIEIKVDATRVLLEGVMPALKTLMKALVDKQKSFTSELKTLRADQDPTPCPPDNTAKVFACLFHVAKYYGEKKDGKVVIQWPALKRYAQRLFLESPIRLEQAFQLLIKLKLAEVQMVKNDTDKDALEEMGPCTFHDLAPVERFFEFYQHFHFKGASPAILKYDEKCAQVAAGLVKLSETERTDKSGVVYMNYKNTCEKLKVELGPSFNPDSILRLESKGLFIKRESNNQGGTLSFIRTEFLGMIEAWKILREVEKWNEKGFVDMNEAQAQPQAGGAVVSDKPILTCPTCLSQVAEAAKFCSACGEKLLGGKAAA